VSRSIVPAALALIVGLSGCARDGDILSTGVITSLNNCPPAAIPAPAGDITLFNPDNSRDAAAIDVVATMTNVRSSCTENGPNFVTNVSFDVIGLRRDAAGARDVVLPFFATVVQGSGNVVAKRVGNVLLRFEAGQVRAATRSSATSQVSRAAAAVPPEIRAQIQRERRPGDPNAALDPLADPAVRAAVEQARYELLVGFELTPDQLRYNATR
jgi:hypothetical protein